MNPYINHTTTKLALALALTLKRWRASRPRYQQFGRRRLDRHGAQRRRPVAGRRAHGGADRVDRTRSRRGVGRRRLPRLDGSAQALISGSGDRTGVQLQFRLDGTSVKNAVGNYSATIIYSLD